MCGTVEERLVQKRRYRFALALILVAGSLLSTSFSAEAHGLPKRIGECRETRITKITTRLMDGTTRRPIYDSGSAVMFSNGGYQVSHSEIDEINRSRVRDRVLMCLVSVPDICPRGDNRGRIYRTINLRTGEYWELPDDTRVCGGA
jgi:hypothetical protein